MPLTVSSRKMPLRAPLYTAPRATIDPLSLRRQMPMSSDLLIMTIAIPLGHRSTLTSRHQAVISVPPVLSLRGQSSVRTGLLIVLGAIAFGPGWPRTSRCLAWLFHKQPPLCGTGDRDPKPPLHLDGPWMGLWSNTETNITNIVNNINRNYWHSIGQAMAPALQGAHRCCCSACPVICCHEMTSECIARGCRSLHLV